MNNFINSAGTVGWDPDVVYYDTLGIGYITSAENGNMAGAKGKTRPILPLNNPFS